MQSTPKGMRLHIGLFGRRNVGKSSILNAVTRQLTSIVSDTAGTTTDPVEKPMEMLPIGPVLFIDTAGIDDIGALGAKRVERTRQAIDRTDLAVIVAAEGEWGRFEEALAADFQQRKIPMLVVFNKADIARPGDGQRADLAVRQIPFIEVSATAADDCRHRLREALIQILPEDYLQATAIAGDLVNPGDIVILVVPIDLEAPKGRLILPQVQTIRDLLDHDACCMVVKERELREAINRLRTPPALVITDSQAFLKVAADTPDNVRLTSFSILFARLKGDLNTFAQGAMAIDRLQSGDRILIAEACTHHQIGDDIGRVKIPRWLTQYVGGKLQVDHIQGCDFPDDLSTYRLVIHCGSCTFNRRHLLSRIEKCTAAGVPVTNYGLAIAKSLGIIERALSPFPGALEAYRR
jgi:[FeFe] hydrogenase H-cluster maturation GTPase HydF